MTSGRELFKAEVEIVPISISSYCNRVCPYCPDSFVDRRSHRNYMADDLFASILRQLADIGYTGIVAINRFNEPLADFFYACNRISQIRRVLKHCSIEVSTNGDYLTRERVESLSRRGVNHLVVTTHQPPENPDFANTRSLMMRRLTELCIAYEIVTDNEVNLNASVKVPGMRFDYRCYDAHARRADGQLVTINDRGGSLPMKEVYVRTAPCFRPLRAFEIEWDGSLWPCCQIHNDVPEHKAYQLGKLTADSDIFEAYMAPAYIAWRGELMQTGPKKAPCTNCTFSLGR